jgi:putative zinc finger protein
MAGDLWARCDRARQWASLRMDDELSELESLMLDRHVVECRACREWLVGVEATTSLLRSGPLVAPELRVEVRPRRLPFVARTRLVAIAAALALVLAASVLGVFLSRPGAPATDQSPQLSFLRRQAPDLQQPKRRPVPPPPPVRRPGAPEDAV